MKNVYKFKSVLVLLLLVMAGATGMGQQPSVTTLDASPIGTSSATLQANINPNNNGPTTVYFEYGLTVSYGSIITATQSPIPNGTGIVLASAPISGLAPGQTYHCLATATNATGAPVVGLDVAFETGSGVTTDNVYNLATTPDVRYTVSATYTGRGYWIGLPSETPGLVLGTIHAIDTTGAAGSFSVAIAGTSSGTTYKICAFKRSGLNPGDYTWGDEIIFTAGNTQPVTYNCLITDDSQINAASYQFSVYIKQTGGTALYLNNYQLGMELNRQDLLDNLYMTGEYVANTCELANLTPAGMTIAFQAAGGGHPYGHMDVRINGLPPSATATLVGTSYKRIGTFIIHNWTSATHTTAKSFGSIQPDLEWDNDFIAKTYIYAYISGASQLITDLNQQITLLTNLAFNSVNWRGISNGDWHENLNWIRNPGLTNTIPASTENVYIPGAPASGTFSSPIVSTSVPLPTCKNLFIGLRTDNNIVKALGNLTINPGGNLTVTGDTLRNLVGTAGLTIGSDATGTGSLIHKTDTVSASIKRYITLNNYHMVSIPDTSASPTSNLFLGSYLYYFDETQITLVDNGWVNMGISTSTPLSQKRGYMIYNPTANTTYTFAGKMNNGSFLPIATFTSGGPRVNQGFNLVPNPYPSAIDWRAALGWAKTNVYDATWIWNPTANNYAAFGADQT
ncbi:MAG: hypothetical protein WCM93_15300, partial [Bacteroidota bacterium]